MYTDEQLSWLFFQGLVPAFGAGALFLLYGCCRYMVGATPFSWKQAIDAQGWLYCGLILSIQAAFRSLQAESPIVLLGVFCIICAIVCGLLLIAAMAQRGEYPSWQAPNKLKAASFLLVIFIIASGYTAQSIPMKIKSVSAKTVAGSKASAGSNP